MSKLNFNIFGNWEFLIFIREALDSKSRIIKVPNPKHQILNPKKVLNFGHWNLDIVWDL